MTNIELELFWQLRNPIASCEEEGFFFVSNSCPCISNRLCKHQWLALRSPCTQHCTNIKQMDSHESLQTRVVFF